MSRATFSHANRTIAHTILRCPPADLLTGILDSKGRQVTADGERGTVRFEEGPAQRFTSTSMYAPGTYYYVSVQVGRDGKRYGAGSETAYFTTEAEAIAYMEKRFDTIMARAAKDAEKRGAEI